MTSVRSIRLSAVLVVGVVSGACTRGFTESEFGSAHAIVEGRVTSGVNGAPVTQADVQVEVPLSNDCTGLGMAPISATPAPRTDFSGEYRSELTLNGVSARDYCVRVKLDGVIAEKVGRFRDGKSAAMDTIRIDVRLP